MHRLVRLVLACAVLAASPAAARADVIDQVVAYVGDRPVFLSELRARARPKATDALAEQDPAQRREALAAVYDRVLETLIDEALIRREADRLTVRVSDRMYEEALERVRAEYGLDGESFWQAVEAQGWTRQQYEAELRAQILRLRVLQLLARDHVEPVTEQDVRREYRERTRDVQEPRTFDESYQALRREIERERFEHARKEAMERLRERTHIVRRLAPPPDG